MDDLLVAPERAPRVWVLGRPKGYAGGENERNWKAAAAEKAKLSPPRCSHLRPALAEKPSNEGKKVVRMVLLGGDERKCAWGRARVGGSREAPSCSTCGARPAPHGAPQRTAAPACVTPEVTAPSGDARAIPG